MQGENKFRLKLLKISAAIQKNRFISGISNGLSATMPMLIGGAIFTLIDSLNITAYQDFLVNTGLKTLTAIPATITTDLIALYASFTIANALSKEFKKDGATAGILSLMAFFLVTPMGTMTDETAGFSVTWLGARGLFVAMIVATLVTLIYSFVIDKKFYIKMPNGVPPTIEKSMAALVPAFIILVFFLIVRGLFSMTEFGDIHTFIFSFVQAPLTHLGGSPIAYMIAILAISVLWFFGVHGALVVLSVMSPIWTPLRLENLTAFQQGLEMPNVIAGSSTYMIFSSIGGSGATLGLAIALLFAKSKQYKTMGKLAFIPSIFGINEPLLFGMPIVLNLKLAIPFVLTPLITNGLGIAGTMLGILPKLRGMGTPTGTPIIVRGFLEGGWKIALFQVLLIGISFVIYYPFFKSMDKEAFQKEELEEQKRQEQETIEVAMD